MMARPFAEGEAVRRCACDHVMVARVGDACPRCGRLFPDLQAVHDALVTTDRVHGPAEAKRIAGVLGVQGDRIVSNGRRVFGVVDGGAR